MSALAWSVSRSVLGASAPALLAAALAAAAVLVLLGGRRDPDDPADAPTPADAPGGGATSTAGEPDRAQRRRAGRLRRGRGPTSAQAVASDADISSALALLALAYRSGLPTWDVLEAVAAGLTGRASSDLRQVATALRWGAGEAEAWASVGRAWAPAARAIAIAHQAGVPPGAMLLAASDDLRATELESLEVAAAKVGVRLVAPLGLVLLPAFCLTTVAPLVIALAGDLMSG